MDFAEPPLTELIAALEEQIVPILLTIVVALLVAWLAGIFVHGIVKALLDREATEGTAQELSAVELKKRMETLDSSRRTSSASSSWSSPP